MIWDVSGCCSHLACSLNLKQVFHFTIPRRGMVCVAECWVSGWQPAKPAHERTTRHSFIDQHQVTSVEDSGCTNGCGLKSPTSVPSRSKVLNQHCQLCYYLYLYPHLKVWNTCSLSEQWSSATAHLLKQYNSTCPSDFVQSPLSCPLSFTLGSKGMTFQDDLTAKRLFFSTWLANPVAE